MGRKTNIVHEVNAQTQAGSEQGSAQAASANLAGTTVGAGARISFQQTTTDAGIIAAASLAGQRLIESQNEAGRQLTELGLRSLESTAQVSENILSRSAEKSAGEPTAEAKSAKNTQIFIIAGAIVAALYFFKK